MRGGCVKYRMLTPGPTPVPEETLLELARPVFYHRSPEFRKEWGHFDRLADEIDPHLYEVAHVVDGK